MNHYDCLKVTSDAPTEVIRAAYRALAGKRHPDRQGGSMGRDDHMHDQMVAINAAYEVLINPELRAEYDSSLLAANTKIKSKPAAGNLAKALEVAESDDGFSETRVDIDWITSKPSGPTPLWPLTPHRKYAAVALCVLLLSFSIWTGWSVMSRHQMDKALSDQYSTHPLEHASGEDQMASAIDIRPTPEARPVALPRPPEVAETPEAVLAAEQGVPASSAQPPPPSFDRQPTVTELSKLSDEELMAILPSLGELQPAKGSFSRQVASTHHPLDGKPLNLRQERQLVDPLAPEPMPMPRR